MTDLSEMPAVCTLLQHCYLIPQGDLRVSKTAHLPFRLQPFASVGVQNIWGHKWGHFANLQAIMIINSIIYGEISNPTLSANFLAHSLPDTPKNHGESALSRACTSQYFSICSISSEIECGVALSCRNGKADSSSNSKSRGGWSLRCSTTVSALTKMLPRWCVTTT